MDLLKAALLDAPQATQAFNVWQARVDLDHLPAGDHNLLPLLSRNLSRLGAEPHPWLGRLKGYHRRTWYANQLILRTLSGVLTTLADCDIPALVVGSAALALTVYPEQATRPVVVPEIVVPADKAVPALTCLETAGWQSKPPLPLPGNRQQLAWRPGRRLAGPQGQGLQMWWHVLSTAPSTAIDAPFWAQPTLLTLNNRPAQTLNPTDHLLWVSQFATHHNPITLADAALLIAGGRIDWERLVTSATTSRLGLHLSRILDTLTTTLNNPVPSETVSALRQIPVTGYDRRAYNAQQTPPTERSFVQRVWLHYARFRRAAEFGNHPASALRLSQYFSDMRQ